MTVIEKPKPAAREPQAFPLSAKAYHALGEMGFIPEKTELLYGQVFRKMPKSPLHRYLAQRLLRLLHKLNLPGFFVWQEQPIVCADSEPEPDLCVIRGDEEDFRTEHPTTAELVIEICVSSHEYDRSKLRAYATAGVKECWLVLAPEKQIEVHRLAEDGQYAKTTLHGPSGTLASVAVPDFSVELDSLYAA
jgi:Uma2 family endonuclease